MHQNSDGFDRKSIRCGADQSTWYGGLDHREGCPETGSRPAIVFQILSRWSKNTGNCTVIWVRRRTFTKIEGHRRNRAEPTFITILSQKLWSWGIGSNWGTSLFFESAPSSSWLLNFGKDLNTREKKWLMWSFSAEMKKMGG